jgi:hypothetical protein
MGFSLKENALHQNICRFWCMLVTYFSAGKCNVMRRSCFAYMIDIKCDMQDKAG